MIRVRSAGLAITIATACNPSVKLEMRGCPCIEGYECKEGICVLADGATRARAPETDAPDALPPVEEYPPETPPVDFAVTLFAELNGDGKSDRIERTLDNAFWVSLGIEAGYGPRRKWMKHGGEYESDDQGQFADLNADGKDDLIFRGVDNSFWVSISTGAGLTTPAVWVSHGGPYVVGQARYEDLNGDRRADLLFRGVDGVFWVSYSTGAGFTTPVVWTPK